MDEPVPTSGPLRAAPTYYIGETYGRHILVRADVARYQNGIVAGIRNKLARRVLRGAVGRSEGGVNAGLRLARALMVQAREVAKEAGKSSRFARRLYEKELALHQPARQPKTRAERRQ